MQVLPVPLQLPLQLAKPEPASGEAVSVTVDPWPNPAEQMVPQLMPPGDEVTVPLPIRLTESVNPEEVVSLNIAVTEVAGMGGMGTSGSVSSTAAGSGRSLVQVPGPDARAATRSKLPTGPLGTR